ncbi:hypothetical protein QFZ82_002101 [Streptomyces sp. V4I23]|uniref:hypothetical protein n=1 Tax=Streptomyces sp. V4I23 TaxID=3042282 RepID=UPI0027804DDF|nr:hypothetical protein [Streptomyces sp. V4I23]MDQ1007616.1 hypothetical protein [Streptomyces sp. V4I23]
MLTYHEVMTTDLGLLTTAAAKWESMAGELKKVETRYGETVQKVSMGQNWAGLSAGVAQTNFTATRYEYSAAQAQAKAIASLLRDAHEKFTDLRRKLVSARDDAIAAGMSVSEQGHVTFDSSKLTDGERNAYRHDPDYQSSVRVAVGEWQKLIEDRVKAVHETDEQVKAALSAAVVDSNKDAFGQGSGKDATFNGFNAHAEGDLDKAPKTVPAGEAKDGTKTDGVKVTGPDVGFTVSGVKYGKEGSVKAYADLFHATAKGEENHGRLTLSGVDEIYAGARATGNLGFTDKGFVAKGEVSAGIRSLAEGRAEYGHVGGYGRLEGFAGGEAAVTAKATKDEVTVGAKAFAGGKISAAGGAEAAGIGVGVTGEGWAGPGAEAWFGYKKDEETGVYKIGGKAGLSPGFGGAAGLEITFDPDKFSKAAGDAADLVGDTVDTVGDKAGDFVDWLTD